MKADTLRHFGNQYFSFQSPNRCRSKWPHYQSFLNLWLEQVSGNPSTLLQRTPSNQLGCQGWKLTKSRRILQTFIWWGNFATLFVLQPLRFTPSLFLSSSEGRLYSCVDGYSLTALAKVEKRNRGKVHQPMVWTKLHLMVHINNTKNYHLADKYSFFVLDWVQPRFCHFLYC